MSEKKTPKTTEGAADAPQAKKKPNMLIIIVVVAVVAMLGTFVAVKHVSAKTKAGAEQKHKEKGPVLALDEFLVNLADSGGDHFLKVTVGLELDPAKGKTPETLKDEVAPIRDAVLSSLSSKQRSDLTGNAGRDHLKAEIKTKVNAALGEADVQDVYFTNFVTQ